MERYASGDVPDNPLRRRSYRAGRVPPGRALDLGCGYGRAAIYLAQHGWQVTASILSPSPSKKRDAGRALGVEVAFLRLGHRFPCSRPTAWRWTLAAVTTRLRWVEALPPSCGGSYQPGGLFLLFSHVRRDGEEAEGEQPSHGLDQEAFLDLFSNGFHAEQIVHGETVMPNGRWPSAWFWMRRILRRR